ncbi:GDP-mannose 4,6-dehydratase, partial [Escherichia coli]|uniref:GDP-mannose 4,6-dehydratase n=1 Tax=Escherichia coli TaxID=562 RepID=UPI002FBEF0BA
SKKIIIYEGDIRNIDLIDSVFANNDIEAVIHFAALKSVSESIKKPIQYYENNVIGTLHLINSMLKNKIYNFIFSSSATVYGNPTAIPVHESWET